MIIINRFEVASQFNTEFFAIRHVWENSRENITFPLWLEKKGVKFELANASVHTLHGITVSKIMFETEQEYLLFKIKYLCS
jgi:hypothetical protein